MPAGADTFILPEWISIRDREKCDLPAWHKVLVSGRGFKRFTLAEPAAIEPLYRLQGPSMWRGYADVGNEFGAATNAEFWFALKFKMNAGPEAAAMIIFTRIERGPAFMRWHPNMNFGTDKNGKHKGWHPCAVIEVPRNYIEQWLASVGASE